MLVMVANNFRKPSIHFVKFYEWICRSPYVKLTEDPFCRQGFRTTLLLGGTLIINPLDFLGWERNGAKRWNIKWHRVVFAVMPFQLKIFRLLCRYPLIHQNLFVCFFWNVWQTCDGIWDSEILRKDFGYLSSTTCYWERFFNKSRPCNFGTLRGCHTLLTKDLGLDIFQHRNGRSFNHSGFKVLNCIPIFLEGWFFYTTLLKIDKCPLKRDHFRRKVVFQLSFFSGAMLVFGGVKHLIFSH